MCQIFLSSQVQSRLTTLVWLYDLDMSVWELFCFHWLLHRYYTFFIVVANLVTKSLSAYVWLPLTVKDLALLHSPPTTSLLSLFLLPLRVSLVNEPYLSNASPMSDLIHLFLDYQLFPSSFLILIHRWCYFRSFFVFNISLQEFF